ncbi:ABC transporter ATP-binding protein [Bacteroidota bacterium]
MIIQVNNLTKRYKNHLAVDNLSLAIPEGSIFGLLGPNGAGKTSFIRILTQITQADEGEILFGGEKLNSSHVLQIGYLPEERGLYKKMKVGEQLLYFAELKGMKSSEAKSRLKYWIDKFEVHTWLNKKVEELSKGMQQKVQFIATVIHQPKLLILDEPFSGFDPINAQVLTDEILNLRKEGATIIFSTHRMDSVELLCDHIALINRSKKVLDGPVHQIKQEHKSNLFELVYTGNTISSNPVFDAQEIWNEGDKRCVGIVPNQNISNRELLLNLMNQGIDPISFREKLPTMEEIFIKTVGISNLENHEENLAGK